MRRIGSLVPLFFAIVVLHISLVSADGEFRQWYPQYGWIFQSILETDCADQYAAYLAGNNSLVQYTDGSDTPGEGVIACILGSTANFIQANMQSAGVLLGIMPFALSVLGSSSEESALLFVIARRPLLTALLLAGSPVVVALRPFEYKDPVGILRSREGRFQSLRCHPYIVLVAEYFFALASVANIAHVTYQLGAGVVCMIWPDAQFLPGLWAITGILVHVIGALCLKSRLRVIGKDPIIKSEFTLSANKTIIVETLPERKLFLILSWFTSTSTTFHVIFGTLAFSSMQFISVKDAFGVIGRYTASVTVNRIIIMYELSGLRESVDSIAEIEMPGMEGRKDSRTSVKQVVPRVFTLSE